MSVKAYRAAMLSGVAFALLLFFGVGQLFSSTPDTSNKSADEVTAKWASYLADSGHRTSIVVGTGLVMLSAIALVWFATAMRARVAPGNSPLLGFALLAATGIAAVSVGPLTLVGGHVFGNDPIPVDGSVIWIVFSFAFPALLVWFGLAAAAFLATVAVAGRGVLPSWLTWFAWLAALGGVFAVEFIPMILVALWFIAAGIHGALRPMGAAEAPAAA